MGIRAGGVLENDPEIRSHFQKWPFAEHAPKYLKMDLYRYEFSAWRDWPEKWWDRQRLGTYMPEVTLEHPALQEFRNL